MKVRNGFVSNSSSASFIVNWKYDSFGQNLTIQEVFGKMFDVNYDECNKANVDPQISSYMGKYQDTMDSLIKDTVKKEDGSYITNFFTTMLNYPEDFGEDAKAFMLCVNVSDGFTVISKKVERD